MNDNQKKKATMIKHVAYLFTVAVLLTGFLTYFGQYNMSESNIKSQTEDLAVKTADEVILSLEEYPAHIWLLRYWKENWDKLDIEYDVDYRSGEATKEKCRVFNERHPDIQIEYATAAEVRALPAEDQKLYAEITYSWLITHLNEIKRTDKVDFIFGAFSDEPYDKQFFVFSAADPGAVRGTKYQQVYTLGVEKTVTESQQTAMRDARANTGYLADAGVYLDYYEFVGTYDAHPLFIGVTYDLSVLKADVRRQALHRTILAVLFELCLAFVCLWLILRYVLRPVKKIQENIQSYIETKDSGAVAESLQTIEARNEIGQLSDDIVEMTREIDDYIREIEAITTEKERLGAEMELAARIQTNSLPNIFPPFPERSEFDIYATMDPAKEVGGDFYDFYMVDDDHLAILIADVSGKGVPAALFMMISKIMINNASSGSLSPAEILKTVNDQLYAHNPEEMFVSVWLGILEVSTGKLTAANAGHEYPAVMHEGGLFELLKTKHGFVIGGMEGIRYNDYMIQIEPGTRLFLYTDGVPEATNGEGKMFGTDRMLTALNKEPDASPKRVLENVRDAVDDFVQDAEQFDDLTMLCLSYIGKKE